MKKLFMGAAVAVTLAGCADVDKILIAHPEQRHASADAPAHFKPLPPSLGPRKGLCYGSMSMTHGGLVISAGATPNGVYSCIPGSPLALDGAVADFASETINVFCDLNKPVSQTPGSDSRLINTHCIYRGPQDAPKFIQGVPVIIVK